MNKQEIIDLAEQVGIPVRGEGDASGITPQTLQRFTLLVSKELQDRAHREIKTAYERGVRDGREACAVLCEQADEECHESFGAHCAALIRASNNKENQE